MPSVYHTIKIRQGSFPYGAKIDVYHQEDGKNKSTGDMNQIGQKYAADT